MSKSNRKWRFIVAMRLVCYFAPFILFVVLYVANQPSGWYDWLVLGAAVLASYLIPIGTLAQVQNARSRRRSKSWGPNRITIFQPNEHPYSGPQGAETVEHFLGEYPHSSPV